jgi:hypothetical protein
MTGSIPGGRMKAKRRPKNRPKSRPKTPEKRRIAAGQALIRRCHSDPQFRKEMVALWRAQMKQDNAVTPGKKGARAAQSE